MKNCILLVFVLLLMSSCKNNIQSQKKNDLYQNIVKAFIKYRNSEKEISKAKNILIIGANTSKNVENAYWLDMCFVNPELLFDFEYSKVYEIDGYKLIMDESLNKSDILRKSFKEIKYENFNLAVQQLDYDPKNWYIVFNSQNEIIRISPQRKSKEIKNILEKKGVKFSEDYQE